MKLLDFSYARIKGKDIKAKGYDGVLRYLSYTPGKNLSKEEIKDYHANGLGIGVVWETTARRTLSGKEGGLSDATEALKQSNALGFPSTKPIYFAVDFDVAEKYQIFIDDYLTACASVIGAERVGVYGSYYVIERCFSNKTASWFWQTLAWSKKQVSTHNHIYQNGKTPGFPNTDENESKEIWGGWYYDAKLASESVSTSNDTSMPTSEIKTLPATSTQATAHTVTQQELNTMEKQGLSSEPDVIDNLITKILKWIAKLWNK